MIGPSAHGDAHYKTVAFYAVAVLAFAGKGLADSCYVVIAAQHAGLETVLGKREVMFVATALIKYAGLFSRKFPLAITQRVGLDDLNPQRVCRLAYGATDNNVVGMASGSGIVFNLDNTGSPVVAPPLWVDCFWSGVEKSGHLFVLCSAVGLSVSAAVLSAKVFMPEECKKQPHYLGIVFVGLLVSAMQVWLFYYSWRKDRPQLLVAALREPSSRTCSFPVVFSILAQVCSSVVVYMSAAFYVPITQNLLFSLGEYDPSAVPTNSHNRTNVTCLDPLTINGTATRLGHVRDGMIPFFVCMAVCSAIFCQSLGTYQAIKHVRENGPGAIAGGVRELTWDFPSLCTVFFFVVQLGDMFLQGLADYVVIGVALGKMRGNDATSIGRLEGGDAALAWLLLLTSVVVNVVFSWGMPGDMDSDLAPEQDRGSPTYGAVLCKGIGTFFGKAKALCSADDKYAAGPSTPLNSADHLLTAWTQP